jgi:hypothetical protein
VPDTPLRSSLLRLALQNPALRKRLSGVLRASGGLTRQEEAALRQANTSVIQQAPIVIQQAPIVVQNGEAVDSAVPPMLTAIPPVATPPMESANNTVTQTPEALQAPPAFSAMLVTERTQKGFETDLVPEMERLHALGKSRQAVGQEVVELIQKSFSKKDLFYNILIRHQSTFESDAAYRESLERLVGVWAHTADSGG